MVGNVGSGGERGAAPMKSKKEQARVWVHSYLVIGSGIVIAAVVPGSTSAALVLMETHMAYEIGKIYRGGDFTLAEGVRVAAAVGIACVAGQLAALEALNFIPFAGWAVKGVVAGGVIKALGEALIYHYEALEPGTT
jgi:uncharacterized protein (DUF697 family)